jgi:hypothetical protein
MPSRQNFLTRVQGVRRFPWGARGGVIVRQPALAGAQGMSVGGSSAGSPGLRAVPGCRRPRWGFLGGQRWLGGVDPSPGALVSFAAPAAGQSRPKAGPERRASGLTDQQRCPQWERLRPDGGLGLSPIRKGDAPRRGWLLLSAQSFLVLCAITERMLKKVLVRESQVSLRVRRKG